LTTEYRVVRPEDTEQLVNVEARAFYGTPTPERVELQRNLIPPEWTVAAFVDGRLVASVRSIPMVRRMNGGKCGIGAVGPVACDAAYRRQGHVGKLLRLALERMRDNGQSLSGLHTPHDALYARYGWERAEGRRSYKFKPKDVRFRTRGAPGRYEAVGVDDWERLARIYDSWAGMRNGPFLRNQVWWQYGVIELRDNAGTRPANAYVWVSESGEDQGYVIYANHAQAPEGRWPPQAIVVYDFVALTGDAYRGLFEHLLTHDLAEYVLIEMPTEDPFPDLLEDPFRVAVTAAEGSMIRIADLERACSTRTYIGGAPVSFTMQVSDTSAPWNDGTWRIEAAEGQTQAARADAAPDLELTANTLAPLFTGHMRPDTAASVGLLKVNRPEALTAMAQAFAVYYRPYCNDNY
jgi:predicted acetyltransferase